MWCAAWDRYTLITCGLKQLNFVACQQHKAVVVQVAAEETGTRGPLVGVLYDELCRCVRIFMKVAWHVHMCIPRKHWEDMTGKSNDVLSLTTGK